MTQLAAQTFLANTKVLIVTAQALTADQNNTLGTIRRDAVVAGELASPQTVLFNPETNEYTYTSFYNSLATGNAIAAAANAFTPAPTSVTVVTV